MSVTDQERVDNGHSLSECALWCSTLSGCAGYSWNGIRCYPKYQFDYDDVNDDKNEWSGSSSCIPRMYILYIMFFFVNH